MTLYLPDWTSLLHLNFTFGISVGLLLSCFWDKIWYRKREYQDGWLHNEILTIWQAACLWVGEEPKLPIAHGTKPYPILKGIEESAKNQEIELIFKETDAEKFGWSKVKRSSIAEYARKRNLKPKFPF